MKTQRDKPEDLIMFMKQRYTFIRKIEEIFGPSKMPFISVVTHFRTNCVLDFIAVEIYV